MNGGLDLSAMLGGNGRLSAALRVEVTAAHSRRWVSLRNGHSLDAILQDLLSAATRDVEAHPRGRLFTRLIGDGPEHEDAPYSGGAREEGLLTDDEAEVAVEFVRSHMVNRFKGDLAELLALPQVIARIEELFPEELSRGTLQLYWGETIRQTGVDSDADSRLAKGADGLLLHRAPGSGKVSVAAIVEVKSMCLSARVLGAQLAQHRARLAGTLLLEERDGSATRHRRIGAWRPHRGPELLAVVPSGGKLSRGFIRVVLEDGGLSLPIPSPYPDEYPTPVAPVLRDGLHRVTLSTSVEELEAAAFSMTFWYMQQAAVAVGEPDPEQHRLRHMLYCLGLRPLRDRSRQLTAQLYNIYNFSYPLSADSRVMLWPDDFPPGQSGVAPAIRHWRGPRTYEHDNAKGWKGWKVRESHRGGRSQLSFERTLTGLAPQEEYDVGFHAGTVLPATVEVAVGTTQVRGVQQPLTLTPPPGPDDEPRPFTIDPNVYRAPIGTCRVTSSARGGIVVRFSLASKDKLARSAVCRLIVAVVPV